MPQLTPMMQQYLDIKEQYKDCILFFRLGDFYEMFFEDAETASKELELVLTGRDCGLNKRAPMCGLPYHAAESYVSRLISKGYKVAICEQVEDPALAKGIVKREIIRVVTPGTVTESSMLDEKKNNYIMSIYKNSDFYGIAYCDVSTGEFHASEFNSSNTQKIIDETARLTPSEIIYNMELSENTKLLKILSDRFNALLTHYKDDNFEYNSCVNKASAQFKNWGKTDKITTAVCACGALLSYIEETQKTSLGHINNLIIYTVDDFMMLDISTRRNLELTETMRNQTKKGSLLWVLDKTETAMGARMLRRWIEEPLIQKEKIQYRLDAVEELYGDIYVRNYIIDNLNSIYDIERLIGKIVYGTLNARDLLSLKQSISVLPDIKKGIKDLKTNILRDIYSNIDELIDVHELIEKSIIDNPPLSVKDGFIIKEGYDTEVDKLRRASKEGKDWIAALEAKEREATGIKSLKVGYNKVFGYYLEITNANKNMVPEGRYMRKQTLSNAERYITPELKEMESTILGAEEKLIQLEYQIFCKIRESISKNIQRLQRTSWAIANLDILCSLAAVAMENDYIKPVITDDGTIDIKDGRHPVVERTLPNNMFVPNDTNLDILNNRVSIITGPNMAGKSTYMRQVALLVIMAQVGSFIPASSASIGVVDRVFTRIGASDDLSSGQSTFMVEMSEVANILNNSTNKSLILLDEVGRGTSTYDGLSIAWAVIEYISSQSKIGAKTLFATHYHELTELEGKIEGIKNYCISVKEHGDDIIFLRKIIRGGADQSYGIQVAKLAGLPDEIIKRAREIIDMLEVNDINNKSIEILSEVKKETAAAEAHKTYIEQLDFFSSNKEKDIVTEIKNIDILNITPIEAMNILHKLIKKVRE
ncbi:DNA mismatch repair protein MutS [Oxobacter pfennigii]|uniref:DNA mismatch repair protein MutS n=1 Tax=Oxobacter pfennigii TaxID=36849 RepID=A0A0N8NTH5_9CLOT|nr:DNA mismatch repair protein MutS [Oxobacter pfennigii]KPU44848.1 DNA mismatch repair protein MutS [Oxobacter pfennigii]